MTSAAKAPTWLVALIVGVSTGLGVVASVYELRPVVAVAPMAALDERDSVSRPFGVSNAGSLPLSTVTISCRFRSALDSDVATETMSIASIAPRGRATIKCRLPVKGMGKLREGDIALITVTFQRTFVPWMTTKGFRFVAHSAGDGTMHWRRSRSRLTQLPPTSR